MKKPIFNIRKIVADFYLRRFRKQMQPTSRSFPGDLMVTKHILVCLPPGLRELTLVKQFLPQLASLFKTADITLLAVPGVQVTDIYPRKGFHLLTPAMDQLTWAGLPKPTFLKSLQEYKFDLVMDLSLEQTNFTSTVLLHFPNAVRIGRGNHIGEPFYNLEIKSKYLRDERNIYRSLLETLAAIMNRTLDGSPVATNG
ncbi:MAG: hypothetical protein SGI97_06160 [candidate division Zixibacteria bacterium]|nr:hypothetical protein [candidate division Zixibacteria bacterium]